MKEKIKKIILWIVLIWFAMVFVGSFIDAIMIFLFGSTDSNPLTVIILLIISGAIVVKVQKELNLPHLFKRKTEQKS